MSEDVQRQKAVARRFQDPNETWSAKFKRKFTENPWVPIGCAATCAALVMSAVKMRQGQSKQMNHWLRARVVLQFATVGALLAGSSAFLQSTATMSPEQQQQAEAQAAAAAEKAREAESREFEARMREAEKTTEMEVGAGFGAGMRRVAKGPAVVDNSHKKGVPTADASSSSSGSGSAPPVVASSTVDVPATKEGKSWFWWRN